MSTRQIERRNFPTCDHLKHRSFVLYTRISDVFHRNSAQIHIWVGCGCEVGAFRLDHVTDQALSEVEVAVLDEICMYVCMYIFGRTNIRPRDFPPNGGSSKSRRQSKITKLWFHFSS